MGREQSTHPQELPIGEDGPARACALARLRLLPRPRFERRRLARPLHRRRGRERTQRGLVGCRRERRERRRRRDPRCYAGGRVGEQRPCERAESRRHAAREQSARARSASERGSARRCKASKATARRAARTTAESRISVTANGSMDDVQRTAPRLRPCEPRSAMATPETDLMQRPYGAKHDQT